MDFSAWSPSHTIFMIIVAIGFIVQIAVNISRTGKLEKWLDKQSQDLDQQGETFPYALECLEDWLDKCFVGVNQRIDRVRTEIGDIRSEPKTEMSEMRSELNKLNQNHIDHVSHHQSGREDCVQGSESMKGNRRWNF